MVRQHIDRLTEMFSGRFTTMIAYWFAVRQNKRATAQKVFPESIHSPPSSRFLTFSFVGVDADDKLIWLPRFTDQPDCLHRCLFEINTDFEVG